MAQTINHHHHHDEHKRVSFGAEEQVTKIVYDALPADGYDGYASVHLTRTTTQFTNPDAPPAKVTVVEESAEIPRPISPPAQIEDIVVATSPPLPSLVKKMEHHETDNPFRPQETLYHEVDPIVEAYKNRPFPPSPVGSPVPHELNASTTTPPPKTVHAEANGHEYSSARHGSTSGATPVKNAHPEVPDGHAVTNGPDTPVGKRNSEGGGGAPDAQPLTGNPDMPPPGKVELVHLEKKKKCGCCSVQ